MPRFHTLLAAASVATVIALLCAPMVAAFDDNELQQLVEAATTLDIDQRGITFTDDKCEHHQHALALASGLSHTACMIADTAPMSPLAPTRLR